MHGFKQQLKVSYDADASRRSTSQFVRESWKLDCRNTFVDLLSKHSFNTILELGAGVGLDSKYFQDSGLSVIATDLSKKMVESCKNKGLEAKVIDLYKLKKLKKFFDGIYSMNVMLHVPRRDLRKVLKSISSLLNPQGIFFYGAYGGFDEEKVITDNEKMGLPRFFSFLSDSSLIELVNDCFTILEFNTIDTGGKDPNFHFQSLFLQKKSD